MYFVRYLLFTSSSHRLVTLLFLLFIVHHRLPPRWPPRPPLKHNTSTIVLSVAAPHGAANGSLWATWTWFSGAHNMHVVGLFAIQFFLHAPNIIHHYGSHWMADFYRHHHRRRDACWPCFTYMVERLIKAESNHNFNCKTFSYLGRRRASVSGGCMCFCCIALLQRRAVQYMYQSNADHRSPCTGAVGSAGFRCAKVK